MHRNDQEPQIIPAPEIMQQGAAWWHAPFAGVIAGMGGGGLCYPFEAAKKRAQSAQVQPWRMPKMNPYTFIREVYRGGSAFTLSLAPVSMMQVTLNKFLEKNVLPSNPSSTLLNAAAVCSGAAGAFFSAPIEHIILTQQKQKAGTFAAMKYLYNRGLTFAWTAFTPLMVREAGFGFSMLMGADAAGQWASNFFQRDLKFPAATLVGIFAAAFTHPFDTIGTYKQRYEYKHPETYRITMFKAAKDIYNENGIRGFFAGYAFRAFLFTGCMVSIGFVEKFVQKTLAEGSGFTFFKRTNHSAQSMVQNEEVKPSNAPKAR